MPDAASQTETEHPWLVVVMGVSGCGKTSVGERLADTLAVPFLEGDSLHPPANIEKMGEGIPLTDDDRWPWLDLIGARLEAAREEGMVISCSALKRAYRERLRQAAGGGLNFVFLHGSRALLEQRMGERAGHFMPASLLDSQLATLENPSAEEGVVAVDISPPVAAVASAALRALMAMRLRDGPYEEAE